MNVSKYALASALLATTGAVHADTVLLAGFDGSTTGFVQDASAAGITATLTGNTTTTANGDLGGTWGNNAALTPAPSTANNTVATSDNLTELLLTFQITNNTGKDVTLENLHIDMMRESDATFKLFDLKYTDGDLDDGTPVNIHGEAVIGDYIGSYHQYDRTFNALSDPTLADGESATFTVNFYAGSSGSVTHVDNLAISGTVVPEPGSLALLGLGGLVIARRRRR